MNTRTRHAHIDFIKAIATIIVMVTHVLAYHLGEYHTWFLWNYSHFVVVGLVFCSAYLYADAHQKETTRLSLSWFIKRCSRLYIPYGIYIVVHSILMNIFPSYFIGYGWRKTVPFFLQNLTLIGGVDFGWLPVLFIQLALLSPVLLSISRKTSYKTIYLFAVGAFIVLTVFMRISSQYTRLIGWLPWSIVAVLGFLYSDLEKRNALQARSAAIIGTVSAFMIWGGFHIILTVLGRPYSFDMHKYPPDISYLSYGAAFTGGVLLILQKYPITMVRFNRLINFLSKNSYQIFFIHFIFLDMVMTNFRSMWIQESLIVIAGACITSYVLNYGSSQFRKAYHPHI